MFQSIFVPRTTHRIGCATMLLLAWVATTALADDIDDLRRATAWVEQLGHDQFADRERASAALILLGPAAKSALEAGRRSSNREIRYRSTKILRLITEIDFQRRLDEFSEDPDPERDYDLPGWKRFRDLVGATSATRSLFVLMQENERALMAATQREDHGMAVLASRCGELRRQMQFGGTDVALGSVVAFLFVATDARINITPGIRSTLYAACASSSFQAGIESGAKREPLAALTEAWIGRDDMQPVLYALNLGLMYDLKGCLPKARAGLKQPATPSDAIYACLCVAKFGDAADLPLVERYLENINICGQAQVNGRIIVTQVRDLALATAVTLSDQKYADYGFSRLQKRRREVFDLSSLGFPDESSRQQAISKWRAFRKQKTK